MLDTSVLQNANPNVYWYFDLYPRMEQAFPSDLPPLEDVGELHGVAANVAGGRRDAHYTPPASQDSEGSQGSEESENEVKHDLPPLGCGNCVEHGFPCLNCAVPSVDGPGHYEGVRYICEESDQEILDILFAWKQAHPYIPVVVITSWSELGA